MDESLVYTVVFDCKGAKEKWVIKIRCPTKGYFEHLLSDGFTTIRSLFDNAVLIKYGVTDASEKIISSSNGRQKILFSDVDKPDPYLPSGPDTGTTPLDVDIDLDSNRVALSPFNRYIRVFPFKSGIDPNEHILPLFNSLGYMPSSDAGPNIFSTDLDKKMKMDKDKK